jgi:hypothetical protein
MARHCVSEAPSAASGTTVAAADYQAAAVWRHPDRRS